MSKANCDHDKLKSNEEVILEIPKGLQTEIERAAALSSLTFQNFILAAAYASAKRVNESSGVIFLGQDEWARLTDIIHNPAEPTDALRKLMKT